MKNSMLLTVVIVLCFLILPPANAQSEKKALQEEMQEGFHELLDYIHIKQGELEHKLRDRKELLREAEKAAANAKDPKTRQKYIETVTVLNQAIGLTLKALDIRNINIKMVKDTIETYKKIWEGDKPKPFAASEVNGEVKYLGKDGRWHKVTEDTTFFPGDKIRTGRDGSVIILFPKGSWIQLSRNSLFSIHDKKVERGIIHFFKKVWLRLKGERIRIRTPNTATCPRATEFDLEVDEKGLSHLTPYDGVMDLTVEKDIAWSKVDRWWERDGKATQASKLEEGETLLVVYTQGNVKIQKGDRGPLTDASIGYTLEPAEKLVTAKGALVHLAMQGGFTGTLCEEATLKSAFRKDSGGPLFLLEKGRLHLKGEASESKGKPVFLTPNTVIKPEETELDIVVHENGVTRVTPYSGRVTIEATMERLDETKIDRWWDEIYR